MQTPVKLGLLLADTVTWLCLVTGMVPWLCFVARMVTWLCFEAGTVAWLCLVDGLKRFSTSQACQWSGSWQGE